MTTSSTASRAMGSTAVPSAGRGRIAATLVGEPPPSHINPCCTPAAWGPTPPRPWFASDFAAEIGVRNYPRLAVFSGDLRGAVHARSQWPSPSVEAVRGDQVGDLLAGDRGRDQPGRGRPQVAHRRIDGDRDTAHGQGRRLGRAGTQTRTTWHATRLAVGSGTGGDRAADRGGQGAGDRAVGRAGKIRLGL